MSDLKQDQPWHPMACHMPVLTMPGPMHGMPLPRALTPLQPLSHPGPHAPPPLPGVSVSLQNAELWKQFHQAGTEMIITKLGRRMFPALRLRISGLEPDARYFVILELVLAAPNRFKFSGGRWVSAGAADSQPPGTRFHAHQDSPAPGSAWMAREVSFYRAKLTNNTLDRSGNLVLTSMHRYLPRVHVIRASDILALHCSPTATFSFPETEFVAVTAYQNDRITKMKIDNNPFAKGFRETGMSRCKRKQMASVRKPSHDRDLDSPTSREGLDADCEPALKQTCSDARSVSSRSSHDDSGVSSLGSASPTPSATPPATPPSTPPSDWATSTPAAPPKFSLSIERLLAKDEAPRRPPPVSYAPPYAAPYAPCAPWAPWADPLYIHALHSLTPAAPSYPPSMYLYQMPPYGLLPYPPSLAAAPLPPPIPAPEPCVVDLSLKVKREH